MAGSMIAQCCGEYPLRPVDTVTLQQRADGSTTTLWIVEGGGSRKTRQSSFNCVNEALLFCVSILRRSYVTTLEFGRVCSRSTSLPPEHWAMVVDAKRSGGVRQLQFACVDFSALGPDAFLLAVAFRGLRSLVVIKSVVPGGFGADDLLRVSVVNGLRYLPYENNENDSPHLLSDDAVLDFSFPKDAAALGSPSLYLMLEGTAITEMFFTKFVERLRSSLVRPYGRLVFNDAPKQRGLSAYAQYRTEPIGLNGGAIYRFPEDDDENSTYKVELVEDSSQFRMHMQFGLECRTSW